MTLYVRSDRQQVLDRRGQLQVRTDRSCFRDDSVERYVPVHHRVRSLHQAEIRSRHWKPTVAFDTPSFSVNIFVHEIFHPDATVVAICKTGIRESRVIGTIYVQ